MLAFGGVDGLVDLFRVVGQVGEARLGVGVHLLSDAVVFVDRHEHFADLAALLLSGDGAKKRKK